MNDIKNSEKNKSAVILNPERREWVSRSHVTSVEIVVNDGVKTKPHHALRRSLRALAYGSTLKMTDKALSLSGASSEKQKESSLILRKAKFQAIFKFDLSSASGGAGGGKYNRISAFVSMPVLLIRRSLEKFFKKNFRDDRFYFGFAKVLAFTLLFTLITTSESQAACNLTNDNGDTVDEFGNYCGTCGADCHWVLDDKGNMKITGSGKMADYHPNCVSGRNPRCTTEDRPWQKYREQIKNVDIQGVTTVGDGAFYTIPIENLTFGNSITTLRWDAFEGHNVKILELPDSLTTIEFQALASNLRTLIVPDTLTTIGISSITKGGTLNIICRGNNCDKVKNLLKNYKYMAAGGTYDQDLSVNFSLADSSNCDTENFYWSGENCARKDENGNIFCASGYAEYKNKCWDELPFAKKRWTPAEANEWLHDGNDNFVVITFKK